MSDLDVAEALRSDAPVVVIEAPAGYGKTYQGAAYAQSLVQRLERGRMLVLTHTNAACDVFARRTIGLRARTEIRTLDSFIVQIASAYSTSLGLPADVAAWARRTEDGYRKLAAKVASLFGSASVVPSALCARYPVVLCDEHQDSSEPQHAVVVALGRHGSRLRVFADPMQAIYSGADQEAWETRWSKLIREADQFRVLTTPHRWNAEAPALGHWIDIARRSLREGEPINLSSVPRELSIILADNIAEAHGRWRVEPGRRHPIDRFVQSPSELLILAPTNQLAQSTHAFFNRRFRIWEGHTRSYLEVLARACETNNEDAADLAVAVAEFIRGTTTGLTKECEILRNEVASKCARPRRGLPGKMQRIAQHLLDKPDHRGVAQTIEAIGCLVREDPAFARATIDLPSEFQDAIKLQRYEAVEGAISDLAAKRSHIRRHLPSACISTIHKAKGFERHSVLILPVDRTNFAATDYKRRLLYVALSRATRHLTLVVSPSRPSPLIAE